MPANSTITTEPTLIGYIYGNLNIGTGTLAILGGVNDSIFDSVSISTPTVSGSANIVQTNVVHRLDLANTYIGNYTANGIGMCFSTIRLPSGTPTML